MKWMETANRMKISLGDLNDLVNGKVNAQVAARLNVSISDIEEFIHGKATANMTTRLGLEPISAAEELAKSVGEKGAIGIVMGLLLTQ
jgi:plasmid maintenance system antidote protein VapI